MGRNPEFRTNASFKNTIEIGLNLDPDGFAEYFARCSILHIAKLEDLPESAAR